MQDTSHNGKYRQDNLRFCQLVYELSLRITGFAYFSDFVQFHSFRRFCSSPLFCFVVSGFSTCPSEYLFYQHLCGGLTGLSLKQFQGCVVKFKDQITNRYSNLHVDESCTKRLDSQFEEELKYTRQYGGKLLLESHKRRIY